MKLSAIAAIGENRELGKDGDLLWRIKADHARMRDLTTGHPLIMGRKTYESIGRPLPNRTTIIITSNTDYEVEGCVVTHSLDEAIHAAAHTDTDEAFIFGGAKIYELALPQTERLYLTRIHATDPEADTFFPAYDEFTTVVDQEIVTDNDPAFEFITLER